MTPRYVKVEDAPEGYEYRIVPEGDADIYIGDPVLMHTSGIRPIEYRVVILPDEVEEKSKGGIIIPQDVRERHQMAQVQGVLVAAGGLAFTVDGDPWPDPPKVGDRVMIAKYAGLEAEGKDGKKYRVCNDKDVVAVVR